MALTDFLIKLHSGYGRTRDICIENLGRTLDSSRSTGLVLCYCEIKKFVKRKRMALADFPISLHSDYGRIVSQSPDNLGMALDTARVTQLYIFFVANESL